MSASKFDKLWNILSTYHFEVDENVSDEVLCTICKNIIIDSHTASCGCHYCCDCIKAYIGNERKHCPGNKSECSEEYLIMEINVLKDLGTRRKIANLIIKCPNESCPVQTKLDNMEEHIRICSKRLMKCPFTKIGCSLEILREDTVNGHLNSDTLIHSHLLIEVIDNLRNDVEVLKKTIEQRDKEINDLIDKEQMWRRDEGDMRNEIIALETAVREMKTREMLRENEITVARFKEEEIEMELKLVKNEILETKKREEEYEGRLTTLKNETTKYNEEMDIAMRVLTLNAIYDFVWSINEFTKKGNGQYDSDPFYKDNYKLCVRAEINNYTTNIHLGLFAIIMKGDNDNKVQWPMKHTISVSILNQDSLKTHKCWRLNHDNYKDKSVFNKPSTDMNEYIYCGSIHVSDNVGILSRDSVLVCVTMMI